MTLALYHHKGACSLAPLIALEEAGLDYELKVIDLARDRADYLKINPAGKVPALLIDGELLTENPAILYRIASMRPEAGLYPEEPAAASRLLSLLAWFSSTVHIIRRQVRMPMRFTPDAMAQERLVEAGRPKMWETLQEMERRLGDADWFGGTRFSVADAYALVFYDWALVDGFDMAALGKLTAWKTRMLTRPGVRAALRNHAGPLHDSLRGAVA